MTTQDAPHDTGDLLAAYDSQLRLKIPAHPAPGQKYELFGSLLRVTGQSRGFIETAAELGVEGEALDALVAEHRNFFAARGEAVEWKTRSHDTPRDLPARLVAAGFVAEETETVVIGRSAALAGAEGDALAAGVSIREVSSGADIDRIAALESAVWGEDFSWLAEALTADVASGPDEIVIFLAEAAGLVVSAGWLRLVPGAEFASLWGGSTLEPWRGGGIYRALVATRAARAHERGARYLQVDASDDSRPILESLGFVAVTTTTPYVWSPPAA